MRPAIFYSLVIWTFLLAAALNQAIGAEDEPVYRTGEEDILAALEEKTEFDFVDEPIRGIVDYFRKKHRIEIQIDVQAFGNWGLATPITKRLKNITLRSALNLILREDGITWTVADEVLLITTPEAEEVRLITRVYDVGDLVTVQDAEGNRWQDFDSLIRVIVSTVDPCTWAEVGGPGSIADLEYRGAKALIVRQTFAVHEKVETLLKDLRVIVDRYDKDVIPTREKPKPQPQPSGAGVGEGFF